MMSGNAHWRVRRVSLARHYVSAAIGRLTGITLRLDI